MPEAIIKTSPESTAVNALQVAVFEYTHPSLGAIKIPYSAVVDIPSFVIAVVGSTVGADKNHLTIWNGSTRKIRIRKIEACANITANITGATIMLAVHGINTQPTGGTDVTANARKLATYIENLPAGIELKNNATSIPVANYVLAIRPLHVEETVTTSGDSITLFNKDNEISSIHLEQNQGISIRQGTLAGAGAINIVVYFSLD